MEKGKTSGILSIVCICLFTNLSFGQIKFKDQFLKVQDGIASTTKYNTVVNYMKGLDYKLESKEKDDDGEYYIFSGNFSQMVIAGYSKNKELMFVKSNLLPLNVPFCESELKDKEFIKIFSKDNNYEGTEWTATQWGKSSVYPYQFMFEIMKDEKMAWMYLYTANCEGYKL